MRLMIALLVLVTFAAGADAQVEVRRHGEENPVATIAKATLWGGLAGLVLGGAIALVAEENEADIIKWSFVGGTFFGFGFGLYHVLSRPKPTSALLEIDGDGLSLGMPALYLDRTSALDGGGPRGQVTLLSYTF